MVSYQLDTFWLSSNVEPFGSTFWIFARLVELHSLGVIASRDQENIGLINNSLDDFKLGGDGDSPAW